MPPPPDLSHYVLSPSDSLQIFEKRISPSEFASVNPSPTSPPLAVLVVGQTGAGKSNLVPSLLSALSSPHDGQERPPRRPAHFIADTYKTFHPGYASLIEQNPAWASPATGPDARRWLSMAAQEAVRRRADVLLESACRHPDDFTQLAGIFRDGGYRVEVMLMAVPACLSRLGIVVRYVQKLPEAGSRGLPTRLTPKKVHDDSYEGLLLAAAFLDENPVADQVLVARRANLVAFGVEGGGGGILAALKAERERPLTETERNVLDRGLAALDGMEAYTAQVNEIKMLAKPLTSGTPGSASTALAAMPLKPLLFANSTHDENQHHVLRLGLVPGQLMNVRP